MQDDEFSWHNGKAAVNPRNHNGVTFDQARAVFLDPDAVEVFDDREVYRDHHGAVEERINITGLDAAGNVLVVTYTKREGLTHIISARKANRDETRKYFESRGQF